MDVSLVDRVFQQIEEGWDIPTPQGLLRVKQEDAAVTLPGMPYSIVKNLAHAVFWQDLWLGSLAGKKRPSNEFVWQNDFRDPDPAEWPALRKRFVEGLRKAREYCGDGFGKHKKKTDAEAADVLLAIAIHASYHMGQINVLKRALKKGK